MTSYDVKIINSYCKTPEIYNLVYNEKPKGISKNLSYTAIILFLYYVNQIEHISTTETMTKGRGKGQLFKVKDDIKKIMNGILSYYSSYNNIYLKYIAAHPSPPIDNSYIVFGHHENISEGYNIPLGVLFNKMMIIAKEINEMCIQKENTKYAIIIGKFIDNSSYDKSLEFNPEYVSFFILRLIWNFLIYKPIFIIGNDLKPVNSFNIYDKLNFSIYLTETPDSDYPNTKELNMKNISLFSDTSYRKYEKVDICKPNDNKYCVHIPKYITEIYPEYMYPKGTSRYSQSSTESSLKSSEESDLSKWEQENTFDETFKHLNPAVRDSTLPPLSQELDASLFGLVLPYQN